MNKAIRDEWVKALRSGEYEQGREALCRDNQYCCIGVLYDSTVDAEWESSRNGSWGIYGEYAQLPDDICELVNLDDHSHDRLVKMNDESFCSFSEIADWIEANL